MRVEVLASPVDALTLAETVEKARQAMRRRETLHQVSMNVAKLVKMRSDSLLRSDVLSSHIISADGMGIVYASRLLGHPLPERVAGVDLMNAILDVCAREGFHPYFLGATEHVVKAATEIAKARNPGLVFAGYRNGYFSEAEEDRIVAEIAASKADALFIAMPTPRKERLLSKYRERLGVPFIMGIGGSLDVLAGKVQRAPLWMQRYGLEWLFRIMQEPRRMMWRYISTNTVFAFLLLRALILSRARHNGAAGNR
ncbi:MAG: WecB/TagA/CpsF family glycosyltransferase [Beijerinckiaceae bacterium]